MLGCAGANYPSVWAEDNTWAWGAWGWLELGGVSQGGAQLGEVTEVNAGWDGVAGCVRAWGLSGGTGFDRVLLFEDMAIGRNDRPSLVRNWQALEANEFIWRVMSF